MEPNTQLANKPVSKVDALKNILNAPSVQEQFNNALKENRGSFVASVIDLFNGDASLQACDPKSVVMEALKAAVLKLPINKALGFSYIIAFNNSKKVAGNWVKVMEPTFQIGYKGYIQLAMRTGQYRTINADFVFEGELRSANKLTGEISFDGSKTSDVIVGYFCYFELLNGFSKTLYMTVSKMAEHAKRYSKSIPAATTIEQLISLSKVTVPEKAVGWTGNFNSMALKTVLRNLLSKYGYLSIEMINAMDNDQEPSENENQPAISANKQVIDIDSEEVPNEPDKEPTKDGPDF